MSELKESVVSLDELRIMLDDDSGVVTEESVDERAGAVGDLHNCVRISSYKSRTRSSSN